MAILPELAAVAGITLNLKLAATGEKGPELQGPCPRCGGDDRFHVWPEQYPDRGGSFWCRGCGAGGDGIQFLRDFGKLSFKEACAAVGKTLDGNYRKDICRQPWRSTPIPPPAPATNPEMKPRECTEPETLWQVQAAKYIDQGCKSLLENPVALAKLKKERGITKATAERFNLGLLLPRPGDRLPCRFSSRKLWGLQPKPKAKNPDTMWLPRGLIIPALSFGSARTDTTTETAPETNQVTGFIRLRIRRPPEDIVDGGVKYYVLPGSGMAPLLILNQQPSIVVVESELDAILISQEIGDLVGCLAIGNSSARPDKKTAAILEAIPLLILALDSDPAGAEAAERWEEWYPHSDRLTLPKGIKDPGELHQKGGDLRGWIMAALPSPWRVPPRCQDSATDNATDNATNTGLGHKVDAVDYEGLFLTALEKTYQAAQQRHGAAFLTGVNHLQWSQANNPGDYAIYQQIAGIIDDLWQDDAPYADFMAALRNWAGVYLKIAAQCNKAQLEEINDQLTRNRSPELPDNRNNPEPIRDMANQNAAAPDTRAPPG